MKKPKALPCILVDTREQAPLTRYFDPALVQVEVASLSTGDYSLRGGSELLAIERKSLPDLLSCVTHDRERWLDQMRRMKNYPSRFLVIEATREQVEAEAYRPNVRSASVINSVLGVSVRWNICVVYCDGPKEAARYVQWICRKVHQLQQEGFFADAEPREASTGT